MNLSNFLGKNKIVSQLLGLLGILFVYINCQFHTENVFVIAPQAECEIYSENLVDNHKRADYFLQRRPQPSPVRVEKTQFFPISATHFFSPTFDYSFLAEIFSSQLQIVFGRNYTFFCVKKRYLTFCTFLL